MEGEYWEVTVKIGFPRQGLFLARILPPGVPMSLSIQAVTLHG